MRVLRRAAVAVGAVVVRAGPVAGVDSATAATALTWSRGGNTVASYGLGAVGGQTVAPTVTPARSGSPVVTGASAAGGGNVTICQAVISGPAGIAAGPDEALWFTNSTGNSIGRISTPSPHKIINTRTFAGYQAAVGTGSATSSAASFKVPKLSCATATRAIGPAGVEVNNNKTFSSAFLCTGCVNGKAVNYAARVISGNEINYTTTRFSAGDVISLSTKVTTAGTTVQATDLTKAVTKKRTGAGASASAAYIGDTAWFTSTGTLLGVPNFGTLTFTNCLIDGITLAVALPYQYQRVNSSNTVQVATGALSSAGTAFATSYRHS